MFTPDLTIGTTTFSLRTQRTNGSVRANSARPVSEPQTLTISHEVAKSGRVSTVAYFDDVKVINNNGALSNDTIRVMFKLQYNPLSGRTDTNTVILSTIALLETFLDSGSETKLLNLES